MSFSTNVPLDFSPTSYRAFDTEMPLFCIRENFVPDMKLFMGNIMEVKQCLVRHEHMHKYGFPNLNYSVTEVRGTKCFSYY